MNGRNLELNNEGLKQIVRMEKALGRYECFAVFDGMGGQDYGEEAAYAASEAMKASLDRLKGSYIWPKRYLKELCGDMNQAVLAAAEKRGGGHCGSTVVILMFCHGVVYCCNLGDSRAFRLSDSTFIQLSEDHTDAKLLSSLNVSGRKPRLTQHLGLTPEEVTIEPSIAKFKINDVDKYLLCSDGLTDMLTNLEISVVLDEHSDTAEAAELLTAMANERGGRDNITVIVITVQKGISNVEYIQADDENNQ